MRVRSELTAPLVALSAVLLWAGPASATILTFTNRIAFDAGVPGATVETWDDNPAGTVIPDGTSLDGIIYTTPGPDAQVTDGFQALSPPNSLGDVADGFFGPTEPISFGFPAGALAFGISINTFATGTGAYTATTNLGDIAPSFFDPFPIPGVTTGQFVGFLSDTPFITVTLAAPGGFSYTLDDLNFVPVAVPPVAVPGPATLILVGAGLAGAASWRRSRRG
jgi:PEP-CTERM motif